MKQLTYFKQILVVSNEMNERKTEDFVLWCKLNIISDESKSIVRTSSLLCIEN